VTIQLDDPEATKELPAGSAGNAVIYTERAAFTHIIRKVMIRMGSYINFIRPWM